MSGEVMSAWIGLGGGLAGGALTLTGSYFQRRWDTARDRRREADEHEREARTAARILQADIALIRLRMRAARRHNKFWSQPFDLPLASWLDYREKLAEHIPLAGWVAISDLFRTLDQLHSQALAARSRHPGESRPQLGQQSRRQVTLAVERIEPALKVLERFTLDSIPVPQEDPEDEAES